MENLTKLKENQLRLAIFHAKPHQTMKKIEYWIIGWLMSYSFANAQIFFNADGASNIFEKDALYFNRSTKTLNFKNSNINFWQDSPNSIYIETTAISGDYINSTDVEISQEYTPSIDGNLVYVSIYGTDQFSDMGNRMISQITLDLIDKASNTVIVSSDECFLNNTGSLPCLAGRACPPFFKAQFSLSGITPVKAGKQYILRLRNTSNQFIQAIACDNPYLFGSTQINCQNSSTKADLLFTTTFLGLTKVASINETTGAAYFSSLTSKNIVADRLSMKSQPLYPTYDGNMAIGTSLNKCKDVTINLADKFFNLTCLVANESNSDFPDCFAVTIRRYIQNQATGYFNGVVARVCRIDGEGWGQNPSIYYQYQISE